MNAKTIKLCVTIATILIATIASVVPTAAGTTVSIAVPDEVFEGGTFEVEIKIDDVTDLDSGQFDIYFNSKVVNIVDGDCDTAVEAGHVGDTEIPMGEGCEIEDYVTPMMPDGSSVADRRIRVPFNLPSSSGVSGSGTLATINFEVTGNAEDCSVLNFDHKVAPPRLVDAESNKINATWIDCNVTISGTSEPTSPGAQRHTVTVYVKNRDDDSLNIELHIDGTYKANEKVSKDEKEKYSSYTLDEGVHTFTIKWYDSDTDRWYETTEEHVISGETTVTLVTDEHIEDDYEISACVYMKNLDDDDLDVYLYIDEVYRKYKSISSGSVGDYGEYEFEDDEDTMHLFKIEWYDPDTGTEYEKITTIYITDEEEVVTMHVDKHIEHGIISIPEVAPSPKSMQTDGKPDGKPSTPAEADTADVADIADADATEVTEIPTNTTLATTRDGGSENSISAVCILIASIALLFALMQFKRI